MCEYKNPKPTVDVIIDGGNDNIVLIHRANEPQGWALPGGFVDEGDSNELTAVKEAKEETNMHVVLEEQMYTYSNPFADPRHPTTTTVFIATPYNYEQTLDIMEAQDDADGIRLASRERVMGMIERGEVVLGHDRYIKDYYKLKDGVPRHAVFRPEDDVKTTRKSWREEIGL